MRIEYGVRQNLSPLITAKVVSCLKFPTSKHEDKIETVRKCKRERVREGELESWRYDSDMGKQRDSLRTIWTSSQAGRDGYVEVGDSGRGGN